MVRTMTPTTPGDLVLRLAGTWTATQVPEIARAMGEAVAAGYKAGLDAANAGVLAEIKATLAAPRQTTIVRDARGLIIRTVTTPARP